MSDLQLADRKPDVRAKSRNEPRRAAAEIRAPREAKPVPAFNFILLYVADPAASAAFYERLFARAPLERSDTFAMFALREGVQLGLWARQTVAPKPLALPGGSEVTFAVEHVDAVKAVYEDWTRRGIAIAQPVTVMDFGVTFVALDPDGHRLRVYAPAAR